MLLDQRAVVTLLCFLFRPNAATPLLPGGNHGETYTLLENTGMNQTTDGPFRSTKYPAYHTLSRSQEKKHAQAQVEEPEHHFCDKSGSAWDEALWMKHDMDGWMAEKYGSSLVWPFILNFVNNLLPSGQRYIPEPKAGRTRSHGPLREFNDHYRALYHCLTNTDFASEYNDYSEDNAWNWPADCRRQTPIFPFSRQDAANSALVLPRRALWTRVP